MDCETDEVLSGAHFALYMSVNGIDGAIKDLAPLPGYEDLVSDTNGVIPGINKNLDPGKYYLTETEPPPYHEIIKEDIIFTVLADGTISINSEGHCGYLTIQGTDECNYIIRIPNVMELPAVELTITKTVTGSYGDRTKEFMFTLRVEDAETADEYIWSKNGIPQAEALKNNFSFTLKHGDTVKIMLPVNKNITISEENLYYSTSFKLNDLALTAGNTKTFTLSDNSTLAVTNNLNSVIPTGIFNAEVGNEIYIIAGFFMLFFLAFIVRRHIIKS